MATNHLNSVLQCLQLLFDVLCPYSVVHHQWNLPRRHHSTKSTIDNRQFCGGWTDWSKCYRQYQPPTPQQLQRKARAQILAKINGKSGLVWFGLVWFGWPWSPATTVVCWHFGRKFCFWPTVRLFIMWPNKMVPAATIQECMARYFWVFWHSAIGHLTFIRNNIQN